MEKRQIIRIVFSILIIGVFTTIFIFSNQNGSKSKSVSEKFMYFIVELNPKTSKLDYEEKQEIVIKSQPFIRKVAHFTIYMVLGLLVMIFLSTYNMKLSKKLAIAIFLGIVYAIGDELHQGFIGGRTPRVFDVFIDFLGVLTGSLVVIVLQSFFDFNS